MAQWNTRGLRGSAFEELVSLTNQLYRQHGLALIQKIPTPITPIEVDNQKHTITKAYFEAKSTVDYIGVAQGIPICFDAKETQYKSLPLKNIHPHQVDFMESFIKQEGIAFLLVNFKTFSETYFLPWDQFKKCYSRSKEGGRKSIAYDEFDPVYSVGNSDGFPVHYLEAINVYLSSSSNES